MRVTKLTRLGLKIGRFDRKMKAAGYEQITCAHGIGKLWELDRGWRSGLQGYPNYVIVDAIVGADGKSVWVKTERE